MDLRTRLWGLGPTNFVDIPQSHVLRIIVDYIEIVLFGYF